MYFAIIGKIWFEYLMQQSKFCCFILTDSRTLKLMLNGVI